MRRAAETGKSFTTSLRPDGRDGAAETVPNPASDHEAVIATLQEATVGHLPANLPTTLRARGLRVVEVDGWHGRGRPASTGGFDPVGVLCHHTATSRSSSDAAVFGAVPALVGPEQFLRLAPRR